MLSKSNYTPSAGLVFEKLLPLNISIWILKDTHTQWVKSIWIGRYIESSLFPGSTQLVMRSIFNFPLLNFSEYSSSQLYSKENRLDLTNVSSYKGTFLRPQKQYNTYPTLSKFRIISSYLVCCIMNDVLLILKYLLTFE